MSGALSHLQVVDFSDTLSGQFCARLFADFGAVVTLVEGPQGSPIRKAAPFSRHGDSLPFFHFNSGKRSYVLPSAPHGNEELRLLLATAD
ncbi:MAG: CoA transferase, partial [Pseudomonadota bacterium]|nr:CoA transferase [Pseudomonadota bacterium]